MVQARPTELTTGIARRLGDADGLGVIYAKTRSSRMVLQDFTIINLALRNAVAELRIQIRRSAHEAPGGDAMDSAETSPAMMIPAQDCRATARRKPMSRFDTYRDGFLNTRLGRSRTGVVEAALQTDGGTLIFNRYTHEQFVDLFHAIGTDPDNRASSSTPAAAMPS